MPRTGDVEAWVEIEGERAEEYSVDFSADRTRASCWIPSEPGKSFTVNFVAPRHHLLVIRGEVWTDGQKVGSRTIGPQDPSRGRGSLQTRTLEGFRAGNDSVKCMMFSALQTTSDDAYLDMSASDTLGRIEVKLSLCEMYQVIRRRRPTLHRVQSLVVHEQNKKASEHVVCAGPERRNASRSHSRRRVPNLANQFHYVDRDFMVFTFRYNSRERLKADGVILSEPRKLANFRGSTAEDPIVISDDEDVEPAPTLSSTIKAEKQEETIIILDDD